MEKFSNLNFQRIGLVFGELLLILMLATEYNSCVGPDYPIVYLPNGDILTEEINFEPIKVQQFYIPFHGDREIKTQDPKKYLTGNETHEY